MGNGQGVNRNYLVTGYAEWRVMMEFRKFAATIQADTVEEYFDSRNSDGYLKAFGRYLAERVPEIASNE